MRFSDALFVEMLVDGVIFDMFAAFGIFMLLMDPASHGTIFNDLLMRVDTNCMPIVKNLGDGTVFAREQNIFQIE